MCDYAEHPYTTYVQLNQSQLGTALESYVFTTPIRDKVVCTSGPGEPHVVLIGNGAASVYLDLYVVGIQVVLLSILLVGLPLFFMRKLKAMPLAVVSTVSGLYLTVLIIAMTAFREGRELVLPGMIIVVLLLLLPSYWIYRKKSKSINSL